MGSGELKVQQINSRICLDDGEHVVQFYGASDGLVHAVGGYLASALDADATAVVIATSAHAQAFTRYLAESAIDVSNCLADRRLIMLDAAETLAEFTVDGYPDPGLFDAAIGDVVRDAAARGPLRLFGEMVGLLWDDGNFAAAVELERLWNELASLVPFSLFCAYSGAGSAQTASLTDVCKSHSGVVPTAPSATVSEHSWRFPPTVESTRTARELVTATLADWGRTDLAPDGGLVVAELATNAVRHVGSDFTVSISRGGGGIRLTVGDASVTVPWRRVPSADMPGGYGLRLVQALTSRSGHEIVSGGKLVWAELCTSPAAS